MGDFRNEDPNTLENLFLYFSFLKDGPLYKNVIEQKNTI
jgi:hypothetical protein